MGTWGLNVFSLLETLCTANVLLRMLLGDRHRPPHRAEQAIYAANGIAGLFLAGYTGTLLAATAVPLWSRRPQLLGPLFLSSAISSGCAATALALQIDSLHAGDDQELTIVETTATLAKGGLLAAWVASLGDVARPLDEGVRGRITREGCVLAGVVAPLAIEAATCQSPRWRRLGRITAATLSLAGTLALRYVVVSGGSASAADPRATFAVTS